MTTPDALDIARDLIRCPSVTPEDGGALGYIQKLLEERRLRDASRAFLAGGLSRHRQPLRADRRSGRAPASCSPATPMSCRPATRRSWRFDPFSARDRRRHALGPRRRRHEGRHRRRHRRHARAICERNGAPRGRDLLPHHRRRGRPGRQRHGQAAGMGARARRALRPLHPRRADQSGRARRHDQDRPARLALRAPSSSPASRAMSAIRISPTIPIHHIVRARHGAAGDARSTRAPAHFDAVQPRGHLDRRRQSGDQRHPGRGAGRSSTSASTICGRRRRWPTRSARGWRSAAGGARYEVTFQPTNALAFLTKPGAFVETLSRRHRGRDGPPPGAVDHRRHVGRALHQPIMPECWNSASSARPCTPWTSARAFPTCTNFQRFSRACSTPISPRKPFDRAARGFAALQWMLRYKGRNRRRTGAWAGFRPTFSTRIPAGPLRA